MGVRVKEEHRYTDVEVRSSGINSSYPPSGACPAICWLLLGSAFCGFDAAAGTS